MKIGVSSYSLARAIAAGEFDICGAIRWIAEEGGEHVELVPCGPFSIKDENDPLIERIKVTAAECKVDLSSYTFGANFVTGANGESTPEEVAAEVERVKGQIRIAGALGVKFIRHDVGYVSTDLCTCEYFEKAILKVVEPCREIADYAKTFGITTSVENHGYLFQGSERIHRLVNLVDRDNFRTTMDVGNFCCADEDNVIAVMNNINIASFIHFKDFLIRKKLPTGEGFFGTLHGRFLRGTITGHGDVDLFSIAKVIKDYGYDGYISIEFEGMEECKSAVKTSLANVKQLFA